MAFSKPLVTFTAFAVSLVYFLAMFAIVSSTTPAGNDMAARGIALDSGLDKRGKAAESVEAQSHGAGSGGRREKMHGARPRVFDERPYRTGAGYVAENQKGPGGVMGVKYHPGVESDGKFNAVPRDVVLSARQFANGPGGSVIAPEAGPVGFSNEFGAPLPPYIVPE